MTSPEGNREVFRLAPPLILWWVWAAFAATNIADFVIQGAAARFAIVVSAILLAITGLAYALALRPRVIAEPSGLTVVNPFRDHHVPWAAIQAVDTGDWVRVHYAPGQVAAGPPGTVGLPGTASPRSSAASKVISCWALYVSARTKRRAALAGSTGAPGSVQPAMRPRTHRVPARSGLLAAAGQDPGYAETVRLPGEAKYLASLPTVKAFAIRLDTRAARERARPGQRTPGQVGPENQADPGNAVAAQWAWPPVAAVVLPALALLIAVLA